MSHTYVELAVPSELYQFVRLAMKKAGYEHAFHKGEVHESIDMHGIAFVDIGDASDVFIVTAKGYVMAVKTTNDEAEDAMADLLSETGFELDEGDMDILQIPVGYMATSDEGLDQVW